MRARFLDTSTCPDLMGPDQHVKLLPASAYAMFDPNGVLLWCHRYARYGLPTVELIAWLRTFIDGRDAIEVGAGSGDLCHYLGIRGTDNRLQERPEIALYYQRVQQPTIRYPASVERLDALDAVLKYHPKVIVASWVTHWSDPDSDDIAGMPDGVKEDQLLDTGATYVLIGNKDVHKAKPILRRPHREEKFSFVKSRAFDPSLDRIFIWNA